MSLLALLRGARSAEQRVAAALQRHTWPAAPAADDRAASGSLCSTSGGGSQPRQHQQRRGYAKGGGGAPAKGKPAAGSGAPAARSAEDYSPPSLRAAARARGDPIKELPESHRAFLQSLVPDGAKLRSPRQVGWDLGPEQTMALLHESMRGVAEGSPVLFQPFVVTDLLQSAQSVADWVKAVIENGEEFSAVEQFFVQVLAAEPRPALKGLRVQIKGRLSGKGGKASKKVWQTGATSVAQLADPVDFAKATAETSAGLIGVKVWLVYHREAVGRGSFFNTRLKSPATLQQVLAMPRTAAVCASSSAWWAAPGPLQPAHVGAGRPYKEGFSALDAFGGGGGAAAEAAAESASGEAAAAAAAKAG